MTLDEVKEATKRDPNLQAVIQAVRAGQWYQTKELPSVDYKFIQSFNKVQKEITVNSDNTLLLRGTHIVIPTILQSRTIILAHEVHRGITRIKQLLREKNMVPGN